jgi:hypothetical protein
LGSASGQTVTDPLETVDVDLSDAERWVLNRGLIEWGGPAYCTDAMAEAMAGTLRVLYAEGDWIATDLQSRRPLTRRDWTRALLATEIVFISDVLGSVIEWPLTTGLDDVETLHTLRNVQLKLAAVILRGGAWV